MKQFLSAAPIMAMLCIPTFGNAQEVAPIFREVPSVMYETYKEINRPVFNQYFEMLVAKYGRTGGTGWAIYNENPKVAYRITVLPEGLSSVPAIQQARVESFEEFTEAQMRLWNTGWGTRHVAIYNAAPNLSYVPAGFSVENIRDLPYNRTTIHHLKWGQQAAFRAALARRGELDRAGGINNLVLTTWTGAIGTEAPSIMIRVSAESQDADRAGLAERQRIRQGYQAAWQEQNQIMTNATRHIERHDQTRINALSYPVRR